LPLPIHRVCQSSFPSVPFTPVCFPLALASLALGCGHRPKAYWTASHLLTNIISAFENGFESERTSRRGSHQELPFRLIPQHFQPDWRRSKMIGFPVLLPMKLRAKPMRRRAPPATSSIFSHSISSDSCLGIHHFRHVAALCQRTDDFVTTSVTLFDVRTIALRASRSAARV